jgi:hypothetical protein
MTKRKRWTILTGSFAAILLVVAFAVAAVWYSSRPPDWAAQIRPGMTFDEVHETPGKGASQVAYLQMLGSDVHEIHRDGWVVRTRYEGDRVTWVEVTPPESRLMARLRAWLGR